MPRDCGVCCCCLGSRSAWSRPPAGAEVSLGERIGPRLIEDKVEAVPPSPPHRAVFRGKHLVHRGLAAVRRQAHLFDSFHRLTTAPLRRSMERLFSTNFRGRQGYGSESSQHPRRGSYPFCEVFRFQNARGRLWCRPWDRILLQGYVDFRRKDSVSWRWFSVATCCMGGRL